MRQETNITPGTAGKRAGTLWPGRIAVLAAALFIYVACGAPAWAMQILSASDHAELTAEISGTAVSRIALHGDRIARVIRAPDGFAVEHDAARGDLYLSPLPVGGAGGPEQAPEAVSLFLGTEKGFTYRLILTVSERESAQVLIRNADAVTALAGEDARKSDPYRGALVALIRAVARREPLPGYVIEADTATESTGAVTAIETWRGPRFAAHVLETPEGAPADAGDLAALFASGIAAAWLSEPGSGPGGGRLAVVVQGPRNLGDLE